MARYGVETRRSSEHVIEQALTFFGEQGLGLEVVAQNPCCITFEGGGGHVSVTVAPAGEKTAVELETREWDYRVKQFIREID